MVGEPITIGDSTLIPLISVGFGFGLGGGSGKGETKQKGEGTAGGGGAGGGVKPIAVIIPTLERNFPEPIPCPDLLCWTPTLSGLASWYA